MNFVHLYKHKISGNTFHLGFGDDSAFIILNHAADWKRPWIGAHIFYELGNNYHNYDISEYFMAEAYFLALR